MLRILVVSFIDSPVHLVCKIGRESLFRHSSRCWPLPKRKSSPLDQLRHSQYQLHKSHSSFLIFYLVCQFMRRSSLCNIKSSKFWIWHFYSKSLTMFAMNCLDDVISCIFRLPYPNWRPQILKASDDFRNFYTL